MEGGLEGIEVSITRMAGSELSRAKKKGGGPKWGLRVLQASEVGGT